MTENEAISLAEKFLDKEGVEYISCYNVQQKIRVDREDGIYYDIIRRGKRIISDTPEEEDCQFLEKPGSPLRIWCLAFSTPEPDIPPHIISSLRSGFMVFVDDETGYCEMR